MPIYLEKCLDKLTLNLDSIFTSASDPGYWALNNLGIDLFDNELEVLNDVCDLNVEYLAIVMARGSGKTFSCGLGLVKLCIDNPGFQVGVFGPKMDQAARIIKEISTRILTPASKLYNSINWKKTTASRLTFINGSEILAISAAEATMNEGYHFHLVVLDETHRISDISVNQRIIPMLGSFKIAKMIKLGISMYKQNFWKSCQPNSGYKVLRRDWTECPILLQKGSILYKGKEYPKYVVDQMPLSLKRKYFPDRPDLHFDGSMTELDFNTQYEMLWAADINLLLNEEDQKTLVSGVHDILLKGRNELHEKYFFGLDTASGSLLPGKKDLDWTVLSLWTHVNGIKQKVKCYQWRGAVLDQMQEIKSIIHPQTGIFPAAFGLADYSNVAIAIVEQFKAEGIPIEGITFNHTEPISKKNYKNAMVDQFLFELRSGRVQFPSLEKLDTDVSMKNSFNEWLNVERHLKLGINSTIAAPSGEHDDHVMADVMAVWAIDKTSEFKTGAGSTYKIPDPVVGVARVMGGNIPLGDASRTNRYAKP